MLPRPGRRINHTVHGLFFSSFNVSALDEHVSVIGYHPAMHMVSYCPTSLPAVSCRDAAD